MAYDEALAGRIRAFLHERRADVREQRMFGGIAFMVAGNMCVGVIRDDLMVRLGEERADAALDEPHARPMDFTGRPMKNLVYVDAAGTGADEALRSWIDRALAFVDTLPAK